MLANVSFVVGSCAPQAAFAAAIGSSSHADSVRAVDGNGNVLPLPDVGYKVFELMRATAPTLVTDEFGNTPTFGLLGKVCIETNTYGTWDTLVFDTTSTSVDVNTTGRRLIPPMMPQTTGLDRCIQYDVQFTRGLVIMRNSTTGGAWLYWRPNGGRR